MPPQIGEIRHGSTESVQWDGSRWQPVTPPSAPQEPSHGILPSALSSLGGLLGLVAPEAAIPGELIGSSVNELTDALPKLAHAGIGPMSTEGVGSAMLQPAAHMAEDVLGNYLFGKAGQYLGKGAQAIGDAAENALSSAVKPAYRALSGVGAHMLGLGPAWTAATELGTTVGPKATSLLGKGAEAVGKGFTEGPEELAGKSLQALKDAIAPTARERLDAGAAKYAEAKGARAVKSAATAAQDEAALKGSGLGSNVRDAIREPISQDVMPNVTPDWTVGSEAAPTPGETYNRGLQDTGFSQKMVNKLGEPAEEVFPKGSVSALKKAAAETIPAPSPYRPGATIFESGPRADELTDFFGDGGLGSITPENLGDLGRANPSSDLAEEQNMRMNPQTGETWAGDSPVKSDLMDEFQATQGPQSEFNWPEAGGKYTMNPEGSHVLEPKTLRPFAGENLPASLDALKTAAYERAQLPKAWQPLTDENIFGTQLPDILQNLLKKPGSE